ncbi:TRAP transporter small permease [Pararhodobacter sp. CCB-MM2]|uniref:TRAP transporter small permease n=1 Tax=Pararhodobacter sp. CCB-MM2 TaxID=1786003 RepID=UPI0008336A10|nr:TRAP transporter small permease [Pararhodobacter sp. CCB-MM2]
MGRTSVGKILASALDALAILATLAVAALTFFIVIARFTEIAVVGIYEIILLAAVLMYMLGAVIASRNGSHLRVDWLDTRLTSPGARRAQRLAIATVSLITTGFFVYWTYRMFAWGLVRPQHTPAYGIPLWIPQAAFLIGSVGCFLCALRDTINALRGTA